MRVSASSVISRAAEVSATATTVARRSVGTSGRGMRSLRGRLAGTRRGQRMRRGGVEAASITSRMLALIARPPLSAGNEPCTEVGTGAPDVRAVHRFATAVLVVLASMPGHAGEPPGSGALDDVIFRT